LSDRESNKKFFDRWAPRYEQGRMRTWFQHYQSRVLDRVAEAGGGDLLDIGCGTGWLVRSAARRFPGIRAVGVDLSSAMVAEALANTAREGTREVAFIESDSGALPFAAGTFDFITCTASFHHYADPISVMKGWRSLLRPGGRILVLESCTRYFPIWVYDKVLRIIENGHVQYYRTEDLTSMAEESGFTRVQVLWKESGMFMKGKLFSSLVLVEGSTGN